MRNFLIIIFSIALLFSVNTKVTANKQNVTWYTDFNKALEVAAATNKPLLLFFTGSDWCGWCKRLQAEVFLKEEFKAWANNQVILVELDFPRNKPQDKKIIDQNAALQQQLQVRGYPYIYFVDPKKKNGKVELSILGSLGYEAGGPKVWLGSAQKIVQLKK
jgi:thioredoxin-related protein